MNDIELFTVWVASLFLITLFVISLIEPTVIDYIGGILLLTFTLGMVVFVFYYPIYYFLH